MKKITPAIFVIAVSALSGCITVKTEHKIEPISITVDINVKTDRALDEIFGDLYSNPKDPENK